MGRSKTNSYYNTIRYTNGCASDTKLCPGQQSDENKICVKNVLTDCPITHLQIIDKKGHSIKDSVPISPDHLLVFSKTFDSRPLSRFEESDIKLENEFKEISHSLTNPLDLMYFAMQYPSYPLSCYFRDNIDYFINGKSKTTRENINDEIIYFRTKIIIIENVFIKSQMLEVGFLSI